LQEFADWMKINSEAIYETRVMPPYKENNICMTRKGNNTVYFYYMTGKDETRLPDEITISCYKPYKNAIVTLLGTNKPLKWKPEGDNGFKIMVPGKLRKNPPSKYVWVFKVVNND
jgi:alpha-L-fucosidase